MRKGRCVIADQEQENITTCASRKKKTESRVLPKAKELHELEPTLHREDPAAPHHSILKKNKPDTKFRDLTNIY